MAYKKFINTIINTFKWIYTWARLFCGGSAPRPADGCMCLHSWSSRNVSSPRLATPSVTDYDFADHLISQEVVWEAEQ